MSSPLLVEHVTEAGCWIWIDGLLAFRTWDWMLRWRLV